MVELQKKNAPEEEVACKTMLEEFMSESYEFRHNILSDKYEMRNIGEEWRPVTLKSINSISLRLKREIDETKRWKSAVEEYIQSEETPTYDPISDYLNHLPAWDGIDRMREFFDRLPGLNDDQYEWLATWMRSAVARRTIVVALLPLSLRPIILALFMIQPEAVVISASKSLRFLESQTLKLNKCQSFRLYLWRNGGFSECKKSIYRRLYIGFS